MTFAWGDLVTILLLVILEGLLSGDNALVLAVVVQPLPEAEQRKALRYGLIGAFVLRVIATLLAVWLSKLTWVSLVGGLYLLWLPYKHFKEHPDIAHSDPGAVVAPPKGWFGLSLFWTIVIKADLVDLVFAVDSILAAVGMTQSQGKEWVIISGGVLGILMMRMLTMQVLDLVARYPKLIDGAYIVVAWVGVRLVWEYLHEMHVVPFGIRHEVAIAVVLILFAASFIYARAHQQREESALLESAEEVERLIAAAKDNEPANGTGDQPAVRAVE